jgi:hypothetical protein
MRPVANRDRGDAGRFLGVEESVAVGDEVRVVLRQAASEFDDGLAKLDGAFPADVLAGAGPSWRLVAGRHQAGGTVGARGALANRAGSPIPAPYFDARTTATPGRVVRIPAGVSASTAARAVSAVAISASNTPSSEKSAAQTRPSTALSAAGSRKATRAASTTWAALGVDRVTPRWATKRRNPRRRGGGSGRGHRCRTQ